MSLENGSVFLESGYVARENSSASLENEFVASKNGSASLGINSTSLENGSASLENEYVTLENGSVAYNKSYNVSTLMKGVSMNDVQDTDTSPSSKRDYFSDLTIDERLGWSRTALSTVQENEDLQKKFSEVGYTPEVIGKGLSMVQDTEKLNDRQKKEYGDQYAAQDAFMQGWKNSYDQYMITLRLSRIALKGNRDAEASMRLTGPRIRTFHNWVGKQARPFYQNAVNDDEIMDALRRFLIDKRRLKIEWQSIEQAQSLLGQRDDETGEAQAATLARDKKMDEVDAWIGDFREVARVAFKDNPQWLERIGITTAVDN